jgi:hypothetical protein
LTTSTNAGCSSNLHPKQSNIKNWNVPNYGIQLPQET